jgi:hypothetical protein
MDAWIFVVVAAAITVAPAIALTLLCRTEAQKGEERLLPRWAKARAMVTVSLGGAAAMAAIPQPGESPEGRARGRRSRARGESRTD